MTAEGAPSVWIVQQDEYDAADILGVFATEAEALLFMSEQDKSSGHCIVARYRIGWRIDVDD